MLRGCTLWLLIAGVVSLTHAQQDSAAYRAAASMTDNDQRRQAFEEFIARYPQSALLSRANDALFVLYAEGGNIRRALDAARNVMEPLAPDARMSPYNRFAFALAERGLALDTALVWVERAIEIAERTKSRNLSAYQDTKAFVLFKLGRATEAEALQRSAMRGHEDDPEFLAHLGLYERANGKLFDALRTMITALLYDGEMDLRNDVLRWLDEAEKVPRAETRAALVMRTLHGLVDTMAQRDAARSRAAMVMADLGVGLDTALQWAVSAVGNLDAHSSIDDRIQRVQSLAMVFAAQGKFTEALAQLRSIEDLVDPYNVRFWLTLGHTYECSGDVARAEEAYRKGLVARTESRLRSALEAVYAQRRGSLAGLDAMLDSLKAVSSEFDPGRYDGATMPKGKVVLAELFTGAECGPCVGSDLAFDKLGEFYPRSALVIVEYHVHIPGPDPMTTDASWDRYNWYRGQGTPTVVIDGREMLVGGGPKTVTKNRFVVYRYAIQKFEHETPAVKFALSASTRSDSVYVRVTIQQKEKSALRNVRLHIALLERSVQYTGANGIARHAFVVRHMIDGAEGISLTPAASSQSVAKSIAIADIEHTITAYLDNPTAQRSWSYRRPFTGWRARPERLDRSNLAVAVWVQDVETKAVLQACYADVR